MPVSPPDIVRAAYATLTVTSLGEARRFWVDLLGFVVTYEDSSSLYLRGYDELTHHNLVLRTGPDAALRTLAFRRALPTTTASARVIRVGPGPRLSPKPSPKPSGRTYTVCCS